MATVNLPTPRLFQPTNAPDDDHNPWYEAFDQQTQHDLIEEDLTAGRSVCAVLISIVVGGLILGIVAVLLAM
jgi:hypothetical protein